SEGLNVEVNRDYSPTIESVKGLVKAYNELVTKLNTYYTEELDNDYDPLTEEEEDAVTEKQAEELTAKAKSGILRNDATISALLTGIRSAITVKVGDTGMSLQDIGITTVAWDSSKWKTEQGTLQLDETKLRDALESNPNAVQNVLAATGSTTITGTGADATSEAGFLTRVNGFMQQFNTTMRTSNIMDTAQEVSDTAEKTDDLKQKLLIQEEKYWQKFSALETMMSQLTSQQDYLSSMLTSLNKQSK
ncbi:MAG: flagellar filament capping protein FliD, partial [Eubacteriales bacterium]|nr:flagellar filament capping protein FliD [Eubacteriales bacterium]